MAAVPSKSTAHTPDKTQPIHAPSAKDAQKTCLRWQRVAIDLNWMYLAGGRAIGLLDMPSTASDIMIQRAHVSHSYIYRGYIRGHIVEIREPI